MSVRLVNSFGRAAFVARAMAASKVCEKHQPHSNGSKPPLKQATQPLGYAPLRAYHAKTPCLQQKSTPNPRKGKKGAIKLDLSANALLVDEDGNALGVKTLGEIQEIAEERGLLPVKVGEGDGDGQTVVRLMPVKKLQEQLKRIEKAKKEQKKGPLEQIVMMKKDIAKHDLEVKAKQIVRLAEKGATVKVMVMSRTAHDGIDRDEGIRLEKMAAIEALVSELNGEMKIEERAAKAPRQPLNPTSIEMRTIRYFSLA